MSLASTTVRLEQAWALQERRDPPWERWADHHPALRLPPGELRRRLADRDRARSGPILAALVELARGGDGQAALLVTLALLPRMVSAEAKAIRRDGSDAYEQLAGLLWEAIVTVHNPTVAALREGIERNVWRRKWRSERPINAVAFDPDRPGRSRPGDDTAEIALGRVHVPRVLERLESDAAITPVTRRLLEQLAAGLDSTPSASPTARKQRWRALSRLRSLPELTDALTA